MTVALLIGFVIYLIVTGYETETKIISLYVLVDNDGRITYTGSKEQCKTNLTKELKLIKLEGIL